MKKIGFIDYYLSEWHANNYPALIEKQGEDRILFATDSPWQNQEEMIKILKGYNFGKEAEDKIFYKNASHLLNLE